EERESATPRPFLKLTGYPPNVAPTKAREVLVGVMATVSGAFVTRTCTDDVFPPAVAVTVVLPIDFPTTLPSVSTCEIAAFPELHVGATLRIVPWVFLTSFVL